MEVYSASAGTVADVLAKYRDRSQYIILNDSVAQLEHSPFFKVYPVELKFASSDWYRTGTSFSLKKPALYRIADALSINIIDSRRTDRNENSDYAHYTVVGAKREPSGAVRQLAASKTFDVEERIQGDIESALKKWRDGKYYKGWTEVQIRQKFEADRPALRRAKGERAETGAMERLFRHFGCMSTGYEEEDTKKTFIAIATAPNMDVLLMDPEIRRAHALNSIGATNQLYGRADVPHPDAYRQLEDAPQEQSKALPAHSEPEQPPIDPKQVKIDEWASVEAHHRIAFISQLWEKKDHTYSADAWQKLMTETPENQARMIVEVLEPLPDKAAPASQETSSAPSSAPPAQQAPAAESAPPAQSAPPPAPAPSGSGGHPNEAQLKRLFAIGYKAGYTPNDVRLLIAQRYAGITPEDLTYAQYDELCGNERKSVQSWLLDNPKAKRNEDTAELFNGNY